jgi:hypothetical protein
MKNGQPRNCLAIFLFIFFGLSLSTAAQETISYPPPAVPGSSTDSQGTIEVRAKDIVAYNACGREVDYANRRAQMAKGDYGDSGENTTGLLIAKINWLQTQSGNCEHKLKVLRPKNPDGTPLQATLQDFSAVTLQSWAIPETPSSCKSDSLINETEDEIDVDFIVTPTCMRKQVNEAIIAMKKDRQMGTDPIPCVADFDFSPKGDFDVNVRELTRVLYSGTSGRSPVLDQATVDYMYNNLLAARGKVSPDDYSVLADCDTPAGDELGSPEDTADQYDWENELADDIGDIFSFLFYELPLKIAGTAASVVVGIAAAPVLLIEGDNPIPSIAPHFDVRIEETENHKLMIESSRYLINCDIIKRLQAENYGHIDDLQDDNKTVREWLLNRLQLIAKGDFIEYNARPYTRYSLNAILNLYDFAQNDPQLKLAAKIVLDLSEAKFAAGSNNGRRWPPFRRLEGSDGSKPGPEQNLYNYASGADHEVARQLVLAGQTRLLGSLGSGGIQDLVNSAVSSYRLPNAVAEVAVERNGSFTQAIRHAGVEHYYQSPGFTVTAGGKQVDSPYSTLGISRDEDRGVAMPTTVVPTLTGLTIDDVFYFAGVGIEHERQDNTCTYKGFVCGLNPHIPKWVDLLNCGTQSGKLIFVSAFKCFPGTPGPYFYMVAKKDNCAACDGNSYGVMEFVDAPDAANYPGALGDPDYNAFILSRQSAFSTVTIDSIGFGTYVNTSGESIKFGLVGGAGIASVNGNPLPTIATSGDVINSDGTGKATIKSPWTGSTITIDFSDQDNPKETP